jgi:hypothetical protein
MKGESKGRQRPNCFLVAAAMAVLLAAGWAAVPSSLEAATAVTITRADWNRGDRVLKGRGTGPSKTTVIVSDALTGVRLGSAKADSGGRWKLERKLSYGPCSIRAEAAGQSVVKAVSGAPSNCNGSQPPAENLKVLSGLTIEGSSTVNQGATVRFSAKAFYDDGTSEVVTPTWSENSAYASISTDGIFKANTVPKEQSVTVSASYASGSVTKKTSMAVTILDGAVEVSGSHVGRFSSYEGTATCLDCHTDQAMEVHGSVHYQWKGDASETIGLIPGDAGKLGGINDFCIYPDINWIGKLTNTAGVQVDGGCAKCHAGLGLKPDPNPSQAQLENIDCLICHSPDYKRKVELVNGGYGFVPDTEKMTVTILQAASNITLPNKDSCLNCHTKAGGGNNLKRGDIEEAHRNPTRSFDVHMASTSAGGAGLECLDCHQASSHKIAGRGTDLRPRDSEDPVACTNCHSLTPHGSVDVDKHTARVNCTVCHIPTFAKVAPTDMERDWSRPGVLVPETGLYEPYHVKGTNVVPEYLFFNGKSYFYQFGDPAVAGESGRIILAEPEGRITDPGAKIHAFKHHLGNQPMDTSTRRLLPLKIGKFFETGQMADAVKLGAAEVGWTSKSYEFAETERFMGLFHEVAPKESALTCNSCHDGGTRLDFAALGYTPNATRNGKPLCSSCHGIKSASFSSIHSRHVTKKGYDCSTCHGFSKAQ